MTQPQMHFVASNQDAQVIGTYATYQEAQLVVDRLSDAKFDVSKVQIIGSGLRTVEQVLGRVTTGSAALRGAASGAWFGLFIGLMFSIFSPGGLWLWPVLTALIVGAAFGAIFGAIQHAATGGTRDFNSFKALTAAEYMVTVDSKLYQQATSLLQG